MFRKLSLIFSFVVVAGLAFGQFRGLPIHAEKKDTMKRDIKTWTVDDIYGLADTVVIDSLITSYQDNQPINNYSIANSWNGNLGSPLESASLIPMVTIYDRGSSRRLTFVKFMVLRTL